MKKLILGLTLFIFTLLVTANPVSAAINSDIERLYAMIQSLSTKVEALTLRVTNLETEQPTYYRVVSTNNINATAGIPVTTFISCNEGDVAVGGGLNNSSGFLSNWRTIRSVPAYGNDSQWEVTIINEIDNGTFTLAARCLDR